MTPAELTVTPLPDDEAIREYCRQDAEFCRQVAAEISIFGCCLWSPPDWIANNPGRVHVAPDGTQTHYKT